VIFGTHPFAGRRANEPAKSELAAPRGPSIWPSSICEIRNRVLGGNPDRAAIGPAKIREGGKICKKSHIEQIFHLPKPAFFVIWEPVLETESRGLSKVSDPKQPKQQSFLKKACKIPEKLDWKSQKPGERPRAAACLDRLALRENDQKEAERPLRRRSGYANRRALPKIHCPRSQASLNPNATLTK